MSLDRPKWLRVEENGSIGEARTRAFLLDRFWVLERSVDIDGADMIIQRRITRRSLLDREPPKLGFVQSKFYQDDNTTQYVHREYVEDPKGNARTEFFLLCHSGSQDSSKMYFLTAQEIKDNFKLTADNHSRPNCYALPGKAVLDAKWRVSSQERQLDLMEQALINADFSRNRSFISWALPSIGDNETILSKYVEKIETGYDIPDFLFEVRKRAEATSWNLIEALDILEKITETDDPKVAADLAREFDYYGGSVSVRDDLHDADVERAIERHDRLYECLQKHGLLNAHAGLRQALETSIVDGCLKALPFPEEAVFVVDLEFDRKTLGVHTLKTTLSNTKEFQLPGADSERTETCGAHLVGASSVQGFILAAPYSPWTDQLETGKFGPYDNRGAGYLLGEIMTLCLDTWAKEVGC